MKDNYFIKDWMNTVRTTVKLNYPDLKDGELDDEISLQMLKEKIQLLKQIGFELIEKERGKHAAKLKKQKYKNQ